MNKLILGLLLTLILTSFNLPVKKNYFDGQLIKNNGDVIEASIKLFSFDAKNITYIEGDKKQKIKSADLKDVKMVIRDSTVTLNKYQSAKYSGMGKLKENPGEVWMQEIFVAENVNGYNMLVLERGGATGSGTFASGLFFSVYYGLKLKAAPKDNVFYFPMDINWEREDTPKAFNVIFRKSLAKYLKDYCPAIAKKIKKGDNSIDEFEKTLEQLNNACH